jgi:hypothetical protein
MKSLTVEDPGNLFPERRDAILYLVGLGGFWLGIAAALIGADAGLPSFVFGAFIVAAVGCSFLHMSTTRKFETRISGRSLRPWPLGYTSFRTQLIATLPSTVMAAAQRLKLNAIVVTVAMYSALVVGLIALVSWPAKR